MKYIYSIILLVFVSCSGETADTATNTSSETSSETVLKSNDDLKNLITADMKNYFNEFNNGNWDAVIDKMYPGFFNIIPKDQMKQSFSQMKGMGMEMKTQFNSIDKVSEIVEHETGQFCRAYYDANLSVELSGPMLANVDQIKQSFSSSFEDDNIKFDETTNTFDIKAKKSMIAVSEDEGATWSYIEFNEAQMTLLQKVLPAEVISALL